MLLVKITILLWVLFFICRFFVRATTDNITKMKYAAGLQKKLRKRDWILFIIFCLSVLCSVSSLVWFLFIR